MKHLLAAIAAIALAPIAHAQVLVTKGATDQGVVIRIVDNSGLPATTVTAATTGLDLEYRRDGAASVDITETDLSALTDAHADGGLLHIGNGYYRLDLPDAAVATGANKVLVHGTATDLVVLGVTVQLVNVDFNPSDGLMASNVMAIHDDAQSAQNLESYTDGTTSIPANVLQFGNANGTFNGGIPAVNAAQISGDSTAADNWEALVEGSISFAISNFRAFFANENASTDAVVDDVGTAASGAISPVSADVVGESYTWIGKRYRATNIGEVESGYVGPLALKPDTNPGVTIATVDSVSITGAATVTATDLTVDRSRTAAVFTVPALNTEGTYTVRVKVTTVENQQITTTATLKVY